MPASPICIRRPPGVPAARRRSTSTRSSASSAAASAWPGLNANARSRLASASSGCSGGESFKVYYRCSTTLALRQCKQQLTLQQVLPQLAPVIVLKSVRGTAHQNASAEILVQHWHQLP